MNLHEPGHFRAHLVMELSNVGITTIEKDYFEPAVV